MSYAKRILALFLSVILVLGCFAGCGSESGGSDEIKERKIQIGHISGVGEGDKYQTLGNYFAKYVSEYSDGKITIEVVGGGGLGGERDMLEGMALGTTDMSILTNSTLCQFVEEYMILELPYLFTDRFAANEFFTTTDLLDELDAKLEAEQNCVVLARAECGLRHSVNNDHAYSTVADFSGVKMRTMESEMPLAIFKAFGANPTPLAWADCFTAVQQGTLDAVEIPINSIYSDSYYEICKYISLTAHQYASSLICMSADLYNDLSDAEKDIIKKAAEQAAQDQIKFLDESEEEMLQKMIDYGCKVNEPDLSSFKDAVQTVYDHYRDYFGADVFNPIVEQAQEISAKY